MWQPPYLRETQRTSLRRMGLFACLMAVLLLGYLIGRGSRDTETPNQIYLNNAGPAKPTPTAMAGHGRSDLRTPLGRVVRPTDAPVTPRQYPSPSVTRYPHGTLDDPDTGEGPRYVIKGGDENTGNDDPRNIIASSSPLSALESEFVRLVNIERKRAGCAPFRIDRRLVQSARAHSAEMAASGVFSHASPDGTSPWRRMEAVGYRNGGGENIGRGFTSASEAVRGWLASKSYRGNILNCTLTATGVGVMGGAEGPWWTQDFGYS
ncbi:CAP domain-containing protein [Streptosporangium sp. NPDC051022]|uniref:CAP domain-containing protein n=1 Tax=Streptosporangium sp. NPDC051022 TaxID=3155752 RepID=UPI0034468D4F